MNEEKIKKLEEKEKELKNGSLQERREAQKIKAIRECMECSKEIGKLFKDV